jgi:hypothetical protein
VGDMPRLANGSDCLAVRLEWERVVRDLTQRIPSEKERTCRRLSSTLKSCKRLFDAPCTPCDRKAANLSRNKWTSRVGRRHLMPPVTWCHDWRWLLQRRVRELISGWGGRLSGAREGPTCGSAYVPDQQGCYENRASTGGTLGVDDFESTPLSDWSAVRVGVAKTKGKFRVVTMQSAYVKRVLTPVHNALYDHITSFEWCVRGDLAKEHLLPIVGDRRTGESYISGDYEAATDNIYLEVVECISSVIAEADELTVEEREVLLGSFRRLRWRSQSGRFYPINRGSMMGNLVSFPLLCLLNKACFDICSDIYRGPGAGRVGRFNGDDCAFCGDLGFFNLWIEVTSSFGLIVNNEKTGFSDRWIELNSRSYDCKVKRFCLKPVLSFLMPDRSCVDDVLPSVLDGILGLRKEVQMWIVNVLMRYEISIRSVNPTVLSHRWWSILIRRKWFRSCLSRDPPDVKEYGEKRSLETVVAEPVRPRFYDFVSRASRQLQDDLIGRVKGVKTLPYVRFLDRRTAKLPVPFTSPYKLFRRRQWRFVWPKDLYFFLKEHYPMVFLPSKLCYSLRWLEDHPFLTTRLQLFSSQRTVGKVTEYRSTYHRSFWADFPLGYC